MREIEYLKQCLKTLENREDVPIDSLLDGTPDEGQTLEFIEWMKTMPENLQANFLSYLVPYRTQCIPKLQEFTRSKNEEVSLIACEALIKIEDYYEYAKDKLHRAFINEIKYHANDRRSMILHCLTDGFVYVADKEGVAILKYFRDLAEQNHAATIVNWLDIRIRGFE